MPVPATAALSGRSNVYDKYLNLKSQTASAASNNTSSSGGADRHEGLTAMGKRLLESTTEITNANGMCLAVCIIVVLAITNSGTIKHCIM